MGCESKLLTHSLQQEPVIKTRAGKQRIRTGVYSSVCVAMLECGKQLILFQTNVGHAGEWMEDILKGRDPQLDTPVVMSDALSANRVIAPATHALSALPPAPTASAAGTLLPATFASAGFASAAFGPATFPLAAFAFA